MRKPTLFSLFFILICWLTTSANAYAQVVSAQISETSPIAKARYLEGHEDQPVLLFLHGYLATHEFPLIQNLQDYFSFEGYPSLAPTLSLQIPLRENSLNCSSLHLHTLEQDLAEIDGWIQWLKAKGHQQIILIGHSAGSIQLLEYMATMPDPSVSKVILTSLLFLDPNQFNISKQDIDRAGQKIHNQDDTPDTYSFIFCVNNYLATPQSFLSYLTLTYARILESIESLKVPTFMVMGSKDDRLGQPIEDWITRLKQTSSKIYVLEGANHFFSGEHEYILQHSLQKIIELK